MDSFHPKNCTSRCWPELPGIQEDGGLDQWCYMALARLASEGNLHFKEENNQKDQKKI